MGSEGATPLISLCVVLYVTTDVYGRAFVLVLSIYYQNAYQSFTGILVVVALVQGPFFYRLHIISEEF